MNNKNTYPLWMDFSLNSRLISKELTEFSTYSYTNIYQHQRKINYSNFPQIPLKQRTDHAKISNKSNTITLEQISHLLLGSYTTNNTSRNAPSAGKLYPIDILFYINNPRPLKDNILNGLYFYNINKSAINLIDPKQQTEKIASAFLQDDLVNNAKIIIFFIGNFTETCAKYGNRGDRFALIEAGHIAQNFYNHTKQTSLKMTPVGGFLEDSLNEWLHLDGIYSSVIYTLVIE